VNHAISLVRLGVSAILMAHTQKAQGIRAFACFFMIFALAPDDPSTFSPSLWQKVAVPRTVLFRGGNNAKKHPNPDLRVEM